MKDSSRNTAQGPLRILFLCTGNSCRSQMAEGWARHLLRGKVEAYSAGVAPKGMDPRAVDVMAEAGVDISSQRPKSLDEISHLEFDYVITLCDDAQQSCPIFPARTALVHQGLQDPPQLAANAKTQEEALGHYRRVRDQIRAFVERLPEILIQQDGLNGR
ncbi:MAG: arsenate reductase ArsC [bacterium]